MIRLCTGVTPNYLKRALPFIESMSRHTLYKTATVFAVNGDLPPLPVCVAPAESPLPKSMLQNGRFTLFTPGNWSESDVIAFCDADAVLQRPFDDYELALIGNVEPGQVLIGRNRPDGKQTLVEEAVCLSPKVSMGHVERCFPGIDFMACRNCGFVVATLRTWRTIFEEFCQIWPTIEKCFDNPAMVQFGVCYVAQNTPGLHLGDLPLSIHTHGHLGLPLGVYFHEGVWMVEDKVIAFAHAL